MCVVQTSLAFEWLTVSFPAPMTAAPVVLSQIQTHTGADWVNTRHQSITGAGFQVKLEEDGQDAAHNQETIGWVALPAGTGTIGGLTYEAIVTPRAVTHVPYDVTFTASFRGTPALFGSMATFAGADPAHLRQFSPVTNRGAQVFVEEDTCSDAELAHAAESLSLLVIQPTYAAPHGPMPPSDCSGLDAATYQQECPMVAEWHASIDMSGYVGTPVCNVLVSTGGSSCIEYCTSQGGTCRHAQDNDGGCALAAAHDRQDTADNGCNQCVRLSAPCASCACSFAHVLRLTPVLTCVSQKLGRSDLRLQRHQHASAPAAAASSASAAQHGLLRSGCGQLPAGVYVCPRVAPVHRHEWLRWDHRLQCSRLDERRQLH